MPPVAPFAGLHYALDHFGATDVPERVRLPEDDDAPPVRLADLTDLACPPYDVIDEGLRRSLLDRDDRNAVRLEYAPGPDPHGAAAAALKAWMAEGTIDRRHEPAAYYYRHATTEAPDDLTVEGIVVRVLLQPWGEGILPHEHTMPGPKADRLALLHATHTQLSPIMAVYFDRSERYHHVMSRAWSDEWRARDGDGILHQLCAIEPDDRLIGYLGRQELLIADGHHRYETALAYQAEVRADPRVRDAPPGGIAADWIMMMVVNAELSELEIRPTHRILLDADPETLRRLGAGEDPSFRAAPVAAGSIATALDERRDAEEPTFGLVLPDGEAALLIGDKERLADRLRQEPMSRAVRSLDLAALHVALLHDRLGISAGDIAGGRRVAYTRDEADALDRVARGEASAAILVRPTRMEQMAEVAGAGDVMPQKSTYFYPKLLTGMVFNPLED